MVGLSHDVLDLTPTVPELSYIRGTGLINAMLQINSSSAAF